MRRKILPYNSKLVPLARRLRNSSTLSEVLLWKQLNNKQLLGYDFDRQKPIGNYIVDFYCKDLMLAIEIDGCSHLGKADYDLFRQKELESLGVMVLRFDDAVVKKDMDGVLKALLFEIKHLKKRS